MGFTCPLCEQPMEPWLHMPIDCKKGTPLEHGEVRRCRGCRYGAVMPAPKPEQIPEHYQLDNYYTQNRSHFEEGARANLLDRIRTHLAWRVDSSSDFITRVEPLLGKGRARACDLGCGGGALVAELIRRGHDAVGVDPDPAAAVHATSMGARVLRGSAEQLPSELERGSFDVVVMSHSLEHCLDPVAATQNAASLLRSGGAFLCEVPNNAAVALEQVGVTWEMLDVPRHLHFFRGEHLRSLAIRAGLEVRTVYYAGYTRSFQNAWIETESRIWDRLHASGSAARPQPVRNSRLRAWTLLARTAFAPDAAKYDSVGIVATARPAA